MRSLADSDTVQHTFRADELKAAIHAVELAHEIHSRVARLDETVDPRFERLHTQQVARMIDAASIALHLATNGPQWLDVVKERAVSRTGLPAAVVDVVVSSMLTTLASTDPLTPAEVCRIYLGGDDA